MNGVKTLDNFAPDTVTDPLGLVAGTYEVDIYAAGTGPAVAAPAAPILSTTLEMPPGGNVTAVAHLDGAGDPSLSAFLNDTSTALTGQGRVVVRHLAQAPAVDIVANGSLKVFENLINPNEDQVDLPAGRGSGLRVAREVLHGIPGVAFVELDSRDVVRHRIVAAIVDAYQRFEENGGS